MNSSSKDKKADVGLGEIPRFIEDKYMMTFDGLKLSRKDLVIKFDNKNIRAGMSYITAIDRYRTTSNPVFAIEAFNICIKSKIYPPIDVLEWLAVGFNKFLESDIDIEQILGLKGKFSGSTRPSRGSERTKRDESICQEIRALIEIFNITKEQAAEVVSARMEADQENPSLKYETIRSEILPKMSKYEKARGYIIPVLNEDEKRELLNQYPEHVRYILENNPKKQ